MNKRTAVLMAVAFTFCFIAIIGIQAYTVTSIAEEPGIDDGVEAETTIAATEVVSDLEEPKESGSRNPVILVHGWNGWGTNWANIINRLVSNGWSRNMIFNIYYSDPIFASNVQNAYELRAYVNWVLARTGASKVDLVCHSMGGLSARYYIRFLGGKYKVDDYVSMGSPQHGIPLAYIPIGWISAGIWEMVPGSWFLNALNAGDETPGSVHYTALYSYMDLVVQPYWTAKLYDGATNKGRWWVSHSGLLSDYTTYKRMRDAIRY